MTYEEAIKWLKEHHSPDDWECDCKDTEAMRLAIEALEKQVPKKVVERNTYKRCPSCDNIIFKQLLFGAPDYCPYCGQALLWEDTE